MLFCCGALVAGFLPSSVLLPSDFSCVLPVFDPSSFDVSPWSLDREDFCISLFVSLSRALLPIMGIWDRKTGPTGPDPRSPGRGVFEASFNSTLKSSSSIKSRSARWTASKLGSLLALRCGTFSRSVFEGVSLSKGIDRALSRGDAKKSLKFIGVEAAGVEVRFRDEANGEIQIILEIPLFCDFLSFSSGFGESCSFLGRLATSEKKNDVVTVGVRGVLTAGVFVTEPSPPGEKRPCAVGDCNQASTFAVSNDSVTCLP
eukprot:scaffold2335_cov175-Amphora_coffeaeformis.AAC.18